MKAKIPPWEALKTQMCGLTEAMRAYCGHVGEVSNVEDGTCRVTFSDEKCFGYDLERLIAADPNVSTATPSEVCHLRFCCLVVSDAFDAFALAISHRTGQRTVFRQIRSAGG